MRAERFDVGSESGRDESRPQLLRKLTRRRAGRILAGRGTKHLRRLPVLERVETQLGLPAALPGGHGQQSGQIGRRHGADEAQRGVQIFRRNAQRPEAAPPAAPPAPPARRSARARAAARRTAATCRRDDSRSHRRRQRPQQIERVFHRLPPHGIAVAVELDQVTLGFDMIDAPMREREPHRAHRLARHRAPRGRRCRSRRWPRSRRCAPARLRPWRSPPHR